MNEPVLIKDILKEVFNELQQKYSARSHLPEQQVHSRLIDMRRGQPDGKAILADLREQIRRRGIRRGKKRRVYGRLREGK